MLALLVGFSLLSSINVLAQETVRDKEVVTYGHNARSERIATTVPHLEVPNDEMATVFVRRGNTHSEGDAGCWTVTSSVSQPLRVGHVLLRSGDVMRARQLFSMCLKAGLPEAALALAGSYDPSYIADIHAPDAEPDCVLARKWYNEWYRISVEQGAISPATHLDRLLEAVKVSCPPRIVSTKSTQIGRSSRDAGHTTNP